MTDQKRDPNATSDDAHTTAMLNAAAASSTPAQQQQDAVLSCTLKGLADIGIDAQQNTIIAFSAINSDDLCVQMAISIQDCLAAKGYGIRALSVPFKQMRASGTQISISALVSALVAMSWTLQAAGGGGGTQ